MHFKVKMEERGVNGNKRKGEHFFSSKARRISERCRRILSQSLAQFARLNISMASKSVDEDVFEMVERFGGPLPSYVKRIFKVLGIRSLRGLSTVTEETLKLMEKSVKTVLANPKKLEVMTELDKLDLFGEFFADDPKDFEFLPGDIVEINAAVTVAQNLLKDPCNQSNRKRKAGGPPAGEKTRNTKRRDLGDYISNWLARTKFKLSCSFEDFQVFEEKEEVKCKLCSSLTPIRVTKDTNDNWKATTFQLHVRQYHSQGPLLTGRQMETQQTARRAEPVIKHSTSIKTY